MISEKYFSMLLLKFEGEVAPVVPTADHKYHNPGVGHSKFVKQHRRQIFADVLTNNVATGCGDLTKEIFLMPLHLFNDTPQESAPCMEILDICASKRLTTLMTFPSLVLRC